MLTKATTGIGTWLAMRCADVPSQIDNGHGCDMVGGPPSPRRKPRRGRYGVEPIPLGFQKP